MGRIAMDGTEKGMTFVFEPHVDGRRIYDVIGSNGLSTSTHELDLLVWDILDLTMRRKRTEIQPDIHTGKVELRWDRSGEEVVLLEIKGGLNHEALTLRELQFLSRDLNALIASKDDPASAGPKG